MEWIEATVKTHTESVEAISEILIAAGSKGVSIEDPADFFQLNEEQLQWLKVNQSELFSNEDVFVKAYFTEEEWNDQLQADILQKLEALKEFGLELGKNTLEISQMGQSDWADAWKAYYFPVRVSRYLTIVPSWIDYKASQEHEIIIKLDPGMAFGTGTHPTTQLSLMALEQLVRGGETILDVGTGSGVLSIAAKALGVGDSYAFDIDELATRVSKENISLNEFASDIKISENNLLEGIDLPADIIIANILAEILVKMPQDAYRNLKDKGHLILSGIIDSKKDSVVDAYVEHGFYLKQSMQLGDWNCLIFTKGNED